MMWRRRRKHCALAVIRRSQKFSPRRRPPFQGAQDGQNLISWQSQFGKDRCMQFSVIVVTDPYRGIQLETSNKQTNKKYTNVTDRVTDTSRCLLQRLRIASRVKKQVQTFVNVHVFICQPVAVFAGKKLNRIARNGRLVREISNRNLWNHARERSTFKRPYYSKCHN